MPRKAKSERKNPKAEKGSTGGEDTPPANDTERGGATLLDKARLPRLKIMGLNAPESEPPPPADSGASPLLTRRTSDGPEWRDPFFGRGVRLLDFLLIVLLAVGATLSVALTYRGIGHSWDEALYLRPAACAGQWIMDLLRGDWSVLSPSAVRQAWGIALSGDDPLHPEVAPIPKMVIGLGISTLTGYGIPEMIAMRLPIAGVFGLTVALLYVLGARAFGRLPGFIAAVSYWLMPRVFGHAHIAASETLLALTLVLLAYVYLLGIRHPWAAVLTAVAYALAFDTKVSALFIPLPLLVWGQLYFRRDYASNIFALALASPLIAFALWPYLWYDPFVRLAEYIKFYAAHQSTAVFYLGRIWGYIYGPPAPWHYPLIITAIALPVWTLALIVLGTLVTLWRWRRRPVPVLFLMLAAMIIGVCSLPNAPKYDGERLFFGAFAFLALLAGHGVELIESRLNALREQRRRWSGLLKTLWRLGLIGAMAWNVRTLVVVHPDHLNFFNVFVGGAKGAYEKGFETSYWGEAVNEEVIDYLNSITKPGTKFKPLALNELAFLNLQGWGMLSEEGVYTAASEPYDYYILQVRQGFFGNRERALHFGAKPLRVFEAQGVPKIEIFSGDALTTRSLMLAASNPSALGKRTSPTTATLEESQTTESHQKGRPEETDTSGSREQVAVADVPTSPPACESAVRALDQQTSDASSEKHTAKEPSAPPTPNVSSKEGPHGQNDLQFAL